MLISVDISTAGAIGTGWVSAYESNGAQVVIPPQLRMAQASRQEAQSHGDGGGDDADGGHHDDDHLTAIQAVVIGRGHGESVVMMNESWIRGPPCGGKRIDGET